MTIEEGGPNQPLLAAAAGGDRRLMTASLVTILGVTALASPACRAVPDTAKPASEPDPGAKGDAAPAVPPGPACLRVSTCGRWGDCVTARPQLLPFVISVGDPPVTRGTWYRFDWNDRKNELGELTRICVGDAGPCFEALQHVIPCLPYFNPVAADYRCEIVDGGCTKVMDPAPSR